MPEHKHPTFPRLVILKRPISRFYHCRTYLSGRLVQHSLKTDELTLAFTLAEEWYKRQLRASLQQQKKHPVKDVNRGTLISELFAVYVRSLRHPEREADAEKRWSPIAPYWRAKALAEITSETFEDFYSWRKVKNHTLHKDVVLIRQVLHYAALKHPGYVPPLIPKVGKIEPNPRPWLTKVEWEKLTAVSRTRIAEAIKSGRARTARQRVDAYQFAAFMVSSMCRVDELLSLTFERCQVEKVGQRKILRCEFKGKQGYRVAYASTKAAEIYELRGKGKDPTALVFPIHHLSTFRELLKAAKLYVDSFGNRRNYKAMRATSIALTLLRPNPPTIYQIALNAGTSVQMIEKFYAKRLTAESGKDILTATDLTSLWGPRAKRAATS